MKISILFYLMVFALLVSSCGFRIISSFGFSREEIIDTTANELIVTDSILTVANISSMYQCIPVELHPDLILEWSKKDTNMQKSNWKVNNNPIADHIFKLNYSDTNNTDSINFLIDEINWVDGNVGTIRNEWKGYSVIIVYHYDNENSARSHYNKLIKETQELTKNKGTKRSGTNTVHGLTESYEWLVHDPYFLETNLHPDTEYFKIELINAYKTPWQLKIRLELSE